MSVSFKVIGQNLRSARKACRLSQAQAAEKLGMSLLHYGRLERGERNASLPQLAAAAEVLRVPLSALLEGCISGLKSDSLRSASRLSACSSDTLRLIDEIIEVILRNQ